MKVENFKSKKYPKTGHFIASLRVKAGVSRKIIITFHTNGRRKATYTVLFYLNKRTVNNIMIIARVDIVIASKHAHSIKT